MDYRERQRSQLLQVCGLQKLTQKFELRLNLEMVDVYSHFRIKCIRAYRDSIIYKLHVKYYPVTLS